MAGNECQVIFILALNLRWCVSVLVCRHEDLQRNNSIDFSANKQKLKESEHTRLSAPALELNLVAVTTLLFLGSTAPTATSGVSTIATSFGGAVKIVARPNLKGNPAPTLPLPGAGVPFLGEGLSGVVGVRGPPTLSLDLFSELDGVTSEILRGL